jgi:hypothetical protein
VRLIWNIASLFEEVPTFFEIEQFADITVPLIKG